MNTTLHTLSRGARQDNTLYGWLYALDSFLTRFETCACLLLIHIHIRTNTQPCTPPHAHRHAPCVGISKIRTKMHR